MAPIPQPLEERTEPKKRNGFFQNHSPFRRKSKHENQLPSSPMPSSNRNTWGPASQRADNENMSPSRPFGKNTRGNILGEDARSASPEPVDPRANFQLNIGNNVFDVASPDARKQARPQKEEQEELDPIAQALAELKGVTKEGSSRVSADRYAGLSTPQPPATPAVGGSLPGGVPTPLTNTLNAVQRGTPPPSYEQPMSRLGAPKPAHTSRAMQQTTQRYVEQKTSMFNTGASSRPSTRGTTNQEPPRATSPAPLRATSPRPGMYNSQPQAPTDYQRSASPNPYAASTAGGRPRAQTAAGPAKSPYGVPTGRGSYSSSRGGSPGYAAAPRAVSPQPPQPAYANTRPGSRAAGPASRAASPNPQFRQSYDRPSSSRGSDMAGMALQLAPGSGSERGEGSVYGDSQRGRGGGGAQQRPQSSYYGNGGDMGYGNGGTNQLSTRVRSKSVAEPRQYTKEGRMILHYCEYSLPLSPDIY